jgi:hypothetical protein
VDFSLFVVLGIALLAGFLYISSKVREYGGKGCRDCDACLKPLVWRAVVYMTWGRIRGFFVAFISTCPQCGHWMELHQKRDDGSFKD